jgi:hypothetical protein
MMSDANRALPAATRFSERRLRSRVCAVVDMIAVAVGATIYAGAAIDSVASWPSNRVLLNFPDLERAAGVLLLPSWAWLMVSGAMVSGSKPRRFWSGWAPRWPWQAWVCFAVAIVVFIAVIVGGSAVGSTKGDVRVLPGPHYQVSIMEINQGAWTTVPLAQFHLWQARFVRGGAAFMAFGLALCTGCLYLLQVHRKAIQVSQ